MDDTVPPDGWDAISQIEEFYRMLRSPCDSDAPPYLPTILQMWCKSLITMVDLLLAHNSEVLRDDLLSSCLRDHRRGLHELLSPLMTMPSRLMALPYELREQIFAFAVTEWIAAPDQSAEASTPPRTGVRVLQQRPIRIDRLNKPAPPAITLVSRQARAETLQPYYQLNVFECWRPFIRFDTGWSTSTFIEWLGSLGDRARWLRHIVLLYKQERELETYDVEASLADDGFEVPALISNKLELSEYETSYEAMGLPRYFGRQRRRRH